MTITLDPDQYVHPNLPSGFTYANEIQARAFEETGSVHGASKVAIVDEGRGPWLAIRNRPPRSLDDVLSSLGKGSVRDVAEYVSEYNKGWRAADRAADFPSGTYAFDDGYLDRAAGRAKWHLTYCADHDECGEG